MLAKLIVWGEDREQARGRLIQALGECQVVGVSTNIELLMRVAANAAFASGDVDTGLIDRHRETLLAPEPVPEVAFHAAALADFAALAAERTAAAARSSDPSSPWHATDAWWNNTSTHGVVLSYADGPVSRTLTLQPQADGAVRSADAETTHRGRAIERDGTAEATLDGIGTSFTVVRRDDARHVFGPGVRAIVRYADPLAHAGEEEPHAGHLMAPMSGTIVAVLVAPGATVPQGAPLVVLEAMKMEHTIVAPARGIVRAVNCGVGERVAEGTDLVDLDDTPA
jgi:3-methylcrotonyl-CoA carboxylase alpha subunit